MDYLILQDILTTYSFPTLIVAVIVCAVTLTINKFFDKLPKLLKVYIPFLLAIIFYTIYEMIFVLHAFDFRIESLYAGLLSGSLSAIISSAINRLNKGKSIGTSATVLLIESILEGYIDTNYITKIAVEIEKELITKADISLLEENIIKKLKNASSDISAYELSRLAKLILSAVSSIKKS